jgi:DNA repair exonuclease SbcCD ATPase subunit
MSATVVFEQPQKKRAELENEGASLDQKIQAMKEDIKKLEEKVTVMLEEKVKVKRAAFEKLESQKKDLEKKLEELEKNQMPSSSPMTPISEVAKKKEESPTARVVCQFCGSANLPNAVFCWKCGKKSA